MTDENRIAFLQGVLGVASEQQASDPFDVTDAFPQILVGSTHPSLAKFSTLLLLNVTTIPFIVQHPACSHHIHSFMLSALAEMQADVWLARWEDVQQHK